MDSQSSLCPAAAPEEVEEESEPEPDAVLGVELAPVELPVLEPEAVGVVDPVDAVAPWLSDVGVEAALQLPAVF